MVGVIAKEFYQYSYLYPGMGLRFPLHTGLGGSQSCSQFKSEDKNCVVCAENIIFLAVQFIVCSPLLAVDLPKHINYF